MQAYISFVKYRVQKNLRVHRVQTSHSFCYSTVERFLVFKLCCQRPCRAGLEWVILQSPVGKEEGIYSKELIY